LQPPLWIADLTQKADSVKKIGLSRCIGPNDKHAFLQLDFGLAKILPILKAYLADSHCHEFAAVFRS
jgi:hypothetical protein